MASFLPNHRKKKERLSKSLQELRRLIKCGVSREKLLQAALRIRDDQIRVLRAKQNQNAERNAAERAIFLKDEKKIQTLKALTAEALLAEHLPEH